jgi:hypothetical protein
MSTFPVIDHGDRVGEQFPRTGKDDHPQIQQENNNERAVDEEDKSLAEAENDSSMFLSKRQQRRVEEGRKFKMELEKARIEAEGRFLRQFLGMDTCEEEIQKYKMEEERKLAEEEKELAEAEALYRRQYLAWASSDAREH